ncbi:serine/threonine protein kinase [Candidatus Peregrinibacteria bacterium]|nr:serine/threonine protein kinase [Candidatus Peregrinibacteria bacterium]
MATVDNPGLAVTHDGSIPLPVGKATTTSFELATTLEISPPKEAEVEERLQRTNLMDLPEVQDEVRAYHEGNGKIDNGVELARRVSARIARYRSAAAAMTKTVLELPVQPDAPTVSLVVEGKAVKVLKLGAGATSDAWFGVALTEKRHPMVLKILRNNVSDAQVKQRLHARFAREIELLESLDGNGAPKVLLHGMTEEGPYFAMEYHAGHTLDGLMEQVEEPDAFRNPDVIVQIAMDMAHAHEKGIIHRDLKPENVHIGDDGLVRIFDYGLAAEADVENRTRLTMSNTVMGTPKYMAPEQSVSPHAATEKADVYSLGCIICEMYTRHTPYVAESAVQLISMHSNNSYQPDLTAIPDPDIREFVARMLTKVTSKDDLANARKRPSMQQVAQFFWERSSYKRRVAGSYNEFSGMPVEKRKLRTVESLPATEEGDLAIPAVQNKGDAMKTYYDSYPEMKGPARYQRYTRGQSFKIMGGVAGALAATTLAIATGVHYLKKEKDDSGPITTVPAVAEIEEPKVSEMHMQFQESGELNSLAIVHSERKNPFVVFGRDGITVWSNGKPTLELFTCRSRGIAQLLNQPGTEKLPGWLQEDIAKPLIFSYPNDAGMCFISTLHIGFFMRSSSGKLMYFAGPQNNGLRENGETFFEDPAGNKISLGKGIEFGGSFEDFWQHPEIVSHVKNFDNTQWDKSDPIPDTHPFRDAFPKDTVLKGKTYAQQLFAAWKKKVEELESEAKTSPQSPVLAPDEQSAARQKTGASVNQE